MGRVGFSVQARPAIEQAGSVLDRSDLVLLFGEFIRLASEASWLAAKPCTGLANDPLVLLDQFNACNQAIVAPTDLQMPIQLSDRNDHEDAAGAREVVDRKQDPFDILSRLTSIPSKQPSD